MVSQVDGALPTHAPNASLSASSTNAVQVAQSWLDSFASACQQGDVQGCLKLIWEDGFWRDLLALTWSYRSLGGKDGGKARIEEVLNERLAKSRFGDFALDPAFAPEVQNLFEDLSFIMLSFSFSSPAGKCSGIARLVPGADGGWEAFTISTILEELHGVPERIGALRDMAPHTAATSWLEQREAEVNYADRSPEVLIIGAGQSGLDTAARLKAYGVDTLCVDRNGRLGDNWRKRYASLRLHDPVHYDHLPYIPFPASWPVYTPAPKLADWLESYAQSLELNVWMSTSVTSATFDDAASEWTVELERGVDGKTEQRTLKPKIIVWACGLGGGEPKMPVIEGMDLFKGKILHSSQHGSGKDWTGKKAVVVGACTSAHDISKDFYDQGVDVTMIQRSSTYIMSVEKGMPMMMAPLYVEGGPPVDFADRINASIPNAVMKELHKRVAAAIKDADQELLDGLHARGFETNQGEDDSGFLMMAWAKAGGYYLNVGASELIVQDKIHFKHGEISHFTADHLVFKDGTQMEADIVVLATGYGDARVAIRKTLGSTIADQCKPFWGLDFEREINGVWRGSGVKNLYLFAGNLALCRFNSKLVALQIKAQFEGVFREEDRCELE